MPRIRLTSRTTLLAILLIAAFLYFTPSKTLHTLPNHASWPFAQAPSTIPSLRYSNDGKLRGWDSLQFFPDDGLGKRDKERLKLIKSEHPIEVLIKRGLEEWQVKLSRQSKSLVQAVKEYKRRYRRPPPKGFDKWWEFCKENNVKIVDDYDQINHDIEPFFALSPAKFQQRVRAERDHDFGFHMFLSPTKASNFTGLRTDQSRNRNLFTMLEAIASQLPCDLELHFSDHDVGSSLLGDDQRQAALEAIEEGTYLSDDELEHFELREGRVRAKGLPSVCPEDSPAWIEQIAKQEGIESAAGITGPLETTFVYDPRPGFDFCLTPELLEMHGQYSFPQIRDTKLRPIFVHSKVFKSPDFLTTPTQAFENATSKAAQEKTMPWEEKTIDKLFWRGSSTGDSYVKWKGGDWRTSHRPRLHLMAQQREGEKGIWVKRGQEWDREYWAVGKLNDVYLDVGLTGKPHQCNKEDGTCDEMERDIQFVGRIQPEVSSKYKYVLDVDGNGWSSRFHRLLMSGSVVFKSTIYAEWFSDWLVPWVHYVPVQIDYSDIYDILSFFVGSPDGRTKGRDDIAKSIADRARKFGEEHWRWEDMQAYMFRLLLEYARLSSDEREKWIYE